MFKEINYYRHRFLGEPNIDLVRETTHEPVILDRVPCNICQREVLLSEALSAEATDYVVYFCGLDCYDRWRNQPDDH